LRTLELERRYHDDAPVQGAAFKVKLSDGSVREGKLDSTGRARVEDVPDGSASVQFGPDARPWQMVDQQKNPDFKKHLTVSDIDALIDQAMGET
jgi:type VI secretion system secreted protein VgrG